MTHSFQTSVITTAAAMRQALLWLIMLMLSVSALASSEPEPDHRSTNRVDAGHAIGPLYERAAKVPASFDGKRLSDWLMEFQPPRTDENGFGVFYEGLLIGTEAQRMSQRVLKNSLLTDVFDLLGPDHPLHTLIDRLPVTGRLMLSGQDPRLLQARPELDPVLVVGDRIAVPANTDQVAVLNGLGQPCLVRFEALREAGDYVRRCLPSEAKAGRTVWVVQPDGAIDRIALGAWAQRQQSAPKPGAWLWVDGKDPEPSGSQVADGVIRGLANSVSTWMRRLSDGRAEPPLAEDDRFAARMARFLATQGPVILREEPLPAEKQVLSEPKWVDGSPGLYQSRDLPVSSGDFGSVGLLQMPSARMKPAGSFTYTMSLVDPYRFYNIFVQPFDWLEGGFRYTKINNREFGPGTEETYTDKGIDVKLRLLKESAWLPQVALGVRDVGGTGLFSGEFLVASKRYGDFDFSLGMGWGYFGKRGNVRNPLLSLSPRFGERAGFATSFATTGQASTEAYFRGPAAVFGGVQYHTPWNPLTVKVEYDGNNYQSEPLGNVFPSKSPWNIGLVYKVNNLLDLRVARERGDVLMVGFSLSADLLGPATQKILDKPMVPVVAKQDNKPADWARAAKDIREETEWVIKDIRQQGRELTVSIDNGRGFYFGPKVERAAAVLNREAPADIDWLNFEFNDRALGLATQSVDRQAFVRERNEYVPAESRAAPVTRAAPSAAAREVGDTVYSAKAEPFRFTVSPTFQQTLGGPSGFLFYQLGIGARAEWSISDKTWVSALGKYRLLDNYDKYEAAGKLGTLPEVRSLLKDYQTDSRFNIPVLQMTHVEKLGSDHYVSVYGGLLEWMFGGAGAEYLYRPFMSPLAVGVDVNRVRQRTFDQRFDFRDYQVNTGHVTAYWDTGYEDILVKFSVGQYLAGDRGFTLDLSRVFSNGVVMGGFFSRTNVTPEQFGEGSFDKGLYLGIPFDAILPKSSSGYLLTGWSPLTRDGGAKLQRINSLYGLTDKTGRRAFYTNPVPIP